MHAKTREKLAKDVTNRVKESLEGKYSWDGDFEDGGPSEFQAALTDLIFHVYGQHTEAILYDVLGEFSIEFSNKNKEELNEAKKENKELKERLKAYESIEEVFAIAKKAT